ncbi:YbhB/YbcL family Raf kinase inhibitor-like protein [Kitasatospora sp. NBC_01287]|uniref:YbhB/YbcL family Raf kinase inhibitor-like protein n=1 Tax=Kitasatospora sp. NBC_01287 TaxID=2903573 RepID=UPI0022569C31|nr:YbhB/YbcL family Raf kinase inhibitor-like protein [Kitasatospora sp. NBC_01287]MCX4744844.1 YbhB/YbcL family Raf kinase inhibitor-like protein [Kitasatospora sp. NBC_01287]
MAILGTLLKNKRAGEANLAWHLPALAGPEVLDLWSPVLDHEGVVPQAHVGKRAGGDNRSPALVWHRAPEGTAQLLLVVEDIDSPTRSPFVHCLALLEPGLVTLPTGALNAGSTVPGVRVLRSGMGHGYTGPEPIKGHGPHRYVFQLFALPAALTSAAGGAALEQARPADVLAAAGGPALGRGRLDGIYTR